MGCGASSTDSAAPPAARAAHDVTRGLDTVDKNGDENVSSEETSDVPKLVNDLIAAMDTDHDGLISQQELDVFLAQNPKWLTTFKANTSTELIKLIDKGSDGLINRGELMMAIQNPQVVKQQQELEAKLPVERQMEVPELHLRPVIASGELALLMHPVCPFARAWFTAAEILGLGNPGGDVNRGKIRTIHVEILDRMLKPPWYKDEIYSKGSVPALQYGADFLLGDSLAVVKWLDENRDKIGAKPGSLMMPDQCKQQFDQIMEQLNPRLIFNLYGLMFNQDSAKGNLLGWKIRLAMQWIEKILATRAGPFFLGDQVSVFEIVLAPFIDRFSHALLKYTGLTLIHSDLVAVTRWWAAVRQQLMHCLHFSLSAICRILFVCVGHLRSRACCADDRRATSWSCSRRRITARLCCLSITQAKVLTVAAHL